MPVLFWVTFVIHVYDLVPGFTQENMKDVTCEAGIFLENLMDIISFYTNLLKTFLLKCRYLVTYLVANQCPMLSYEYQFHQNVWHIFMKCK